MCSRDSRGGCAHIPRLKPRGPFDFAQGRLPALQLPEPARPLKVPDDATADEEVVLAGFTGVGQGQTRRAGPEVPDIEANTELVQNSNVEAESTLENP